MIRLHAEDCRETMRRLDDGSVDVVLTSPFYNTNKKQGKSRVLSDSASKHSSYCRYDKHVDNLTRDEYDEFTVDLFRQFDRILAKNGVVLYNLSYGNNNRDGMFTAINAIITNTNFTIADVIVWKKSSAFPNNISSNKLTRIVEFVFVLVRENEIDSFFCNKRVTSLRKTGQRCFENIFNFIEAKNNDGTCPFNKATYSTELCSKLLSIYAPAHAVVYDPFMGSGTTAVAAARMNFDCIGSEISQNQIQFSVDRVVKEFGFTVDVRVIRGDRS